MHQPLGPVDAHGHGQLAYGGAPVPKKMNALAGMRRRMVGFFRPVELPAEIEHEQIAPSGNGVGPTEHDESDEKSDKELTGPRN